MIEKTEPKELARQARLILAASRALKQLLDECKAEELQDYRYHTSHALDSMIKSVMTCPGVKVTIFAEGEGRGEP